MKRQSSEFGVRSSEWKERHSALRTPHSKLDAEQYLVGGVNSPVRAFRAANREPVMLIRAKGAAVRDTQGRRYVDFIMGWGSAILGHAHPAVIQAARRRIAAGIHLGLTGEEEVELAGAICEAIPSIEQVRFTTSGTEACMTAIRLARGATGRPKILTFEGCYHGHGDGVLVKRGSGLATLGLANSDGVPSSIAGETIVVPYNDVEALDAAVRQFGGELACAIVEPVAANMGVVVPSRAFLQRLRALAVARGFLLLFDEVVTGFRVAYGGVQQILDIQPDLTVLGKIIGGGFPIGAVGGPRRVMSRLAPEGAVYHAGTFAGHPAAMAAGLATLRVLKDERPYERLERSGRELAEGLEAAAARAGTSARVNRFGSMVTVFFTPSPVERFADAKRSRTDQFASFANGLRDRGVLIPPSQFETWFLSVAHTEGMINRVIRIASKIFGSSLFTDH